MKGLAVSFQKKNNVNLDPLSRYRDLLQNSPNNPEIYQELGQQLHRQGSLKEAIDCYQIGIKLQGEPIHLWFYRNLGEALISYQSDTLSVISEGRL